jgi:hypothetical protein
MRYLKVPLTASLIVVVLMDGVVGYRLWDSGWPKRIGLTSDQKGIEQVQVMPVPFTGLDWLILVTVIGVHVVLFYLVWRAWHSSRVRAGALPTQKTGKPEHKTC